MPPQHRGRREGKERLTARVKRSGCNQQRHEHDAKTGNADAALSETVRMTAFPNSRLKGDANLLIMPTLDAANISFNLLKAASGGGVTLGPMLLGVAKPAHILTPSATVRRLVNMTALTVVDCTQRQPQLL